MIGGMELRHLRYFVAVAEEENVSRAAAKLRISQPGVSRQIHDLEDELGFALFARTGKSVRLTAAGMVLFAEARAILQRTAAAVEKARASLASPAELHVGYLPSATAEILPRALAVFQERSPKVQVTLHDLSGEEMPPLLLRKKLDLALTVVRQKLRRELAMKELARYPTCVAVGATHPLAGSKSVRLEQVASEPVATYTRKEYSGYNRHLARMFATVGRRPRMGAPAELRERRGRRPLAVPEAAPRAAALVHRGTLAQGRRERSGESFCRCSPSEPNEW